jgi:hypothetical protein
MKRTSRLVMAMVPLAGVALRDGGLAAKAAQPLRLNGPRDLPFEGDFDPADA